MTRGAHNNINEPDNGMACEQMTEESLSLKNKKLSKGKVKHLLQYIAFIYDLFLGLVQESVNSTKPTGTTQNKEKSGTMCSHVEDSGRDFQPLNGHINNCLLSCWLACLSASWYLLSNYVVGQHQFIEKSTECWGWMGG